jgi:predicted lipoprotein with Yx(FWY)xxD motif
MLSPTPVQGRWKSMLQISRMTISAEKLHVGAHERRPPLLRNTRERMNHSKREVHIMARQLSTAVTGPRPGGSVDGRPGLRAIRGLTAGAGLAAVSVLAACGSTGPGGSAADGQQAATSPRLVVSVRSLPGIGTVLVDSSGDTLYSPQQEAHGAILCTASCLSFWFPVQVRAGTVLRAPGSVTGKLGTIRRPGGMTQLTISGRPLYTFRLDQAPGQAHGNDYTDHFGGVSFTWHAITASGTPAAPGHHSSPAPGDSAPAGGTGY